MTFEFDHRDSILRYLEQQAGKYAANEQAIEATTLRATATSIKAQLDVEAGKGGIASPVDAIGLEVCATLGGAMLRDILAKDRSEGTLRAYYATAYVAKRRLGWSDESIADHLDRDRSTISVALKRAEEIRKEDSGFRRITDELTHGEIRCEHCQMPLLHGPA